MQHLRNYINGTWVDSKENNRLNVVNPATQEVMGTVPFGEGTAQDVKMAIEAAAQALPEWRDTPVLRRVQPLYRLKQLLEENIDDIAATITMECGKTFAEAKAEMQRAIENVEVACGMPSLMQGDFSENVAGGIDEFMIRQPIGVVGCITPFNFPGMIPFWFLPYAIACGNTFVLKPSEKVPLTMSKVFELVEQLDIPKGVLNLVHGGKESVDMLLDHPSVKAISFVGSTAIAKYVYSRGTVNGKRVQAQGGAKNPVVVMPDADVEMTTKIIADSVYGCAGQRCLAASNIILVDDKDGKFKKALIENARNKVTGYGMDEKVEMGAIISKESKKRIETLIGEAEREGARVVVDGRNIPVAGHEGGNFLKPTILEEIPLQGKTITTEIFGPVMSIVEMPDIDEAIRFINANNYGNMACIFTNSGMMARKFRNQVNAGNVGINIGVAAPIAMFPFSGWNESFFGDLHAQGKHAVEFYTQTKVVIERWPKEWTRKF